MNCQLSIIIPCYDIKLSELSKCIDSLEFIAQLMTYEIWIIDDGSHEDVVCEWVKNLNKENIHAIRQENMGPGGARNTGIDHCTGKYLTFIDADDYIFYGPYVQILKTLLEKEPDILCHGAKRLFEGPATMFMIKYDIIPSCCSYIIRRETLGDMRFSPHIYHEDEEFCTRLFLKRAHLVTSIEQAYFYRYRPDSITHKQDQKHLQKLPPLARPSASTLHHGDVLRYHPDERQQELEIYDTCPSSPSLNRSLSPTCSTLVWIPLSANPTHNLPSISCLPSLAYHPIAGKAEKR